MFERHVLLIEDSKEVYPIVDRALSGVCHLTWATTLNGARELLSKKNFDLVLLDVELPDGNGIDFCHEIRNPFPTIPIFFLTVRDKLSEKVLGFSVGADDYIVKPFDTIELKARIEARLKKLDLIEHTQHRLEWSEIQIDKDKQEVKVLTSSGFQTIHLTALEFKLLLFFARNRDKVISRDQILNEVWGNGVYVYSRSVDTHVSKLRRKLGPVSHLIQSVHGTGYKFSPKESL